MQAIGTSPKLADKIAMALSGHHTERGTYGHSLLAARVWSKGGKTRIYVDKRHVGTDGTVDRRLSGIGYIELLASGDIVYDLKQERNQIRKLVEEVTAWKDQCPTI